VRSGQLDRRTNQQSLVLDPEVPLHQALFNDARARVKKRLLRPIEVEAEYGLPTGELAKKRVAGADAPPFLRFGRSIYYDRGDLERWITSSKRNSTSDPGTSQGEIGEPRR